MKIIAESIAKFIGQFIGILVLLGLRGLFILMMWNLTLVGNFQTLDPLNFWQACSLSLAINLVGMFFKNPITYTPEK